MEEYSMQHKKAWEFDAYDFWVRTAGTPNVEIMTLHFYAPIYMLLTICDREPKREAEALKTLEAHIRQFNRLYARNEKMVQGNKKKSGSNKR